MFSIPCTRFLSQHFHLVPTTKYIKGGVNFKTKHIGVKAVLNNNKWTKNKRSLFFSIGFLNICWFIMTTFSLRKSFLRHGFIWCEAAQFYLPRYPPCPQIFAPNASSIPQEVTSSFSLWVYVLVQLHDSAILQKTVLQKVSRLLGIVNNSSVNSRNCNEKRTRDSV